MRVPNQHSASRVKVAHPDLRWISCFRWPDEPLTIRRKPWPLLMIWCQVQSPRFTAARPHDPQMRNLRVRIEIDIFAIEHDPFSIRRRHRRANALEFHHVLKREGMLRDL